MPRSARRGRGRLSRSAEFERVYRQGKAVSDRHLVLYAFPTEPQGPPRLGLSVSRKVGGAVERNRVKRLLREAFDGIEADLPQGHDVVVVARPDARELAEREGLRGVEASLGALLERSGLRGLGGQGGGEDQADADQVENQADDDEADGAGADA